LKVAGAFYCVGKVPPHGGLTTLAAHRVGAIELLSDTFMVDADVDLNRLREEAFGVVWEEPVRVVLRFRADQAPYVAEGQWHPSQDLQWLPDGRLELTLNAGGSFEIRRWILGWGDAVEVIAPDEVRCQIQRILRSAAAFYE
jgi:predicted DNA-binding transcriptional regulator YafY